MRRLASDGNVIIGADTSCWFDAGTREVHESLDDLGPVAWITDELMNRATWVTNRHRPGEEVEPAFRNGLSWVHIIRVPQIGEFSAWKVIVKGEDGKAKSTYILEQDIRDEMLCITRMRWPD